MVVAANFHRSPAGRLSMRLSVALFLCLVPSVSTLTIARRELVKKLSLAVGVSTSSCLTAPCAANAVRGAAELDFEYYVRSAVSGNKREGNILPSAPPEVPPPRQIKEPIRSILLDNQCSSACIPVAALITAIQKTRQTSPKEIENTIQSKVNDYRDKAKKSFFSKSPWREESTSDQYYFDLTSYALWRAAADFLPNYSDRDLFVRELGTQLYNRLRKEGLLQNNVGTGSAVTSVPVMREALQLLTDQGFCKGYRLGEALPPTKNGQTDLPPQPIFDELDDEALNSGASIDLLVSVFEPATLGASLQITGEQSRFGPDIVGGLLAAVCQSCGLNLSAWEVLFVDPEYRPNPKDYFPNEQLLQCTILAS